MRTKFEAHRWYSINIIFDWFSQVFDLVVDGVVVGTRVPFEDNHVCLYINTCVGVGVGVGVGVRITCTHTHTRNTHTHTHGAGNVAGVCVHIELASIFGDALGSVSMLR